MSTTVDIPATVISAAPGAGDFSPSALSTISGDSFTGNVQVAQFFATSAEYMVIGSYGDGSDAFNWSLPAGASLVSMHYVLRAIRWGEFSSSPSDATTVAAAAQFGSVPATLPAVVMRSDNRGDTPYFPDLTTTTSFSGVGDLLLEETNPDAVLVDGHPLNQLTSVQRSDNHSTVMADYLAIRVVYNEAGATTGIPWQRLTNRDEVRLTNRRDRQNTTRLTGIL